MMLLSDSVGGADESRNGFGNLIPVNVTEMSGFMGRIIGKTERMPTILANVLGEPAPLGQEMDVVAEDDANGGMPDVPGNRRLLQKRMAAETRVLLESIARRHVTNAVAEQTAQVAHLLLERRRRRIRIALGVEQERMSALRADVFVTAVAIGEFLVVVLAEEARQRVTNASD
jgi:hypothetical protein